jgi:hypothetical protein
MQHGLLDPEHRVPNNRVPTPASSGDNITSRNPTRIQGAPRLLGLPDSLKRITWWVTYKHRTEQIRDSGVTNLVQDAREMVLVYVLRLILRSSPQSQLMLKLPLKRLWCPKLTSLMHWLRFCQSCRYDPSSTSLSRSTEIVRRACEV